MTHHNDEASPATDYDQILRKLEDLMRKHRHKPSETVRVRTQDQSGSLSADTIPTLTEAIDLAPSALSPQSDITALLKQILDAALKDAGAELDTDARAALVRSLESRLFGL